MMRRTAITASALPIAIPAIPPTLTCFPERLVFVTRGDGDGAEELEDEVVAVAFGGRAWVVSDLPRKMF
jgi:hypothetical protein